MAVADPLHSSVAACLLAVAVAGLAVEKQGQARQRSSQVHPGRIDGVRGPSNRRREQVADHRVRRRRLLQKHAEKHVFVCWTGKKKSGGGGGTGENVDYQGENISEGTLGKYASVDDKNKIVGSNGEKVGV